MRPGAPIARAPRWLWALYAVFSTLALLVLLTFSFGRDQGIYGVVAERWRHGVWPYEGAWDFKPPGIFLIYVAVQGTLGSSEWALRAAEALATVGLLAGLHAYACRVLRSEVVGLVAGMLALLTHIQLDFWHTAQPETFGAPLLVVALLLSDLEGAWASILLGLVGGFLFLVKPPLGAAAAMPLALRLVQGRASFGRLCVAAAASLVPIALVVLAFRRAGAWEDMRQTLFVFAPGYTKLGWENETALTLLYRTIERAFLGFSGPIALGIVLRLLAKAPWKPLAELLVMLVLCIVGTALQAKLFPYHFGSILPLEALVAAEGFVLALRDAAFTGRVVTCSLALAAFVARGASRDVAGTFLERSFARLRAWPALVHGDRSAFDALDKAADLDIAANRALARWFASESAPDEAVFLFGFEPSIYLDAGRAPASRYLYDVPLRGNGSAPHRARLMDDLRRSRPPAIAIERHDRMKMVTGNDRDSFESAHEFLEFMGFLDANYERVGDLGRFERWRVAKKGDIAPRSDTLVR